LYGFPTVFLSGAFYHFTINIVMTQPVTARFSRLCYIVISNWQSVPVIWPSIRKRLSDRLY